MTPRLVLLCGLPGAGKTTLARRLAREMRAPRLCPDEWMARHGYASLDVEHRSRIEHWLTGLAHTLLKHGSYVILESGFWAMADRERHYRIAAAAGADVELHYLDAPLDELARRLSLRNARPEPGGYTVPVERLTVWANEFEPPAPDELARFAPPIRTLCAAAPGRGPAPT